MMGGIKFDYKGKVVVITGASKGIGLSTAKVFLRSKAFVVGLSKSGVKGDLKQHSHKLDIANIEVLTEWISEFTRKRKIDIWINNAAIYPQRKLIDVTEKEWDITLATNLKSLFFASREVAKHMKETGGGTILNATSFASKIPSSGAGIYAATKAAVVNLTRSMAAEWARYKIRVNCYSPGVILTDMTKEALRKRRGKVIAPIALNRYGRPEEVSEVILFLCSDAASYITGSEIEVTGGKFLIQDQETLNDEGN